ncbi:MAG TPA: hypothetical protein VFB81_17810, partial [Myxococcales bacterium]|nr:hypothetical protein [Myxococcales bacterium]
EVYEDALLSELAHALKKKIGPIRSQLHRGQPAFGYQAPERDDDAPIEPLAAVPAGWKVEAAFRVFSRMMAIGELPTSARDGELPTSARDGELPTSDGDEVRDDCRLTLVIPCEGGDWFALRREDDEGGWEFAIVSREHAPHVADLLGFAVRLGAVEVEGGTVHVVDEEVRDDRRYQHGMGHGVGDILGRGFSADVGGDGDTEIFGTRKKGTERYVLFHLKV